MKVSKAGVCMCARVFVCVGGEGVCASFLTLSSSVVSYLICCIVSYFKVVQPIVVDVMEIRQYVNKINVMSDMFEDLTISVIVSITSDILLLKCHCKYHI